MIRYYLSFYMLLTIFISVAFAFNDEITHPVISEKALLDSNTLEIKYLSKHLMLKNEEDTLINGKKIIEWIHYGAKMEDDPPCRASNHFHNPYLDWNAAGLSDTLPLVNWWCWTTSPYPPEEIKSNVTWATGYSDRGYIDPNSDVAGVNAWDWESARNYFYTYLTGLDAQNGLRVAPDETTRNLYLADTLRALGQVMHLVQDTAVPAHVRNDFSQGHTQYLPDHEPTANPFKWFGNLFEDYVRFNDGATWFDAEPVGGNFMSFRITDLWDTNILRADTTPEQLSQVNMLSSLGLAEYTSVNFLSMFTMFNTDTSDGSLIFPYPKPEHCVIRLEKPKDVLTPHDRLYLASWNGHPGETVDKLAVVGYLKHYRDAYFQGISNEKLPIGIDENCFENYAAKLIPRAIGYSAALLDYFFRGRMAIQNPIFTYTDDFGALAGLTFGVKNTSTLPNDEEAREDFGSGQLHLAYHYTPPGQTERVYGTAEGFYSIVDASDPINADYVRQTVWFPEPIPRGARDIVCQVIFRGTLGREADAIAASKIDFLQSRIAYSHQPGGIPNASDIQAVFPNGTDTVSITGYSDTNQWYHAPSWSPDGSVMAMEKESCEDGVADGVCTDYADNQNYFRDILLMDLESELSFPDNIVQDFRLYDPDNFAVNSFLPVVGPSFSPDGSQFVAKVDDAERQYWGLVIVDSRTGDWRYINGWDFWRRKRLTGSGPDWNPTDDTIVYYVHQEPDPVTDDMVDTRDIYIIDKNGGVNARLTHDDYFNTQPSWSPDGEWIVFVSDRDGDGLLDIWVMDRDGGGMQKVLDCESNCWSPSFSPDGLSIAFQLDGNIYTIDTAGGNLEQVTDGGDFYAPEWSPPFKPPEVEVDANPPRILPGGTSTLTWSSTAAYSVEISEGIGIVTSNGAIDVAPELETTYRVTAKGLGGEAADNVTVLIENR